jgi:hypothetical protein
MMNGIAAALSLRKIIPQGTRVGIAPAALDNNARAAQPCRRRIIHEKD